MASKRVSWARDAIEATSRLRVDRAGGIIYQARRRASAKILVKNARIAEQVHYLHLPNPSRLLN
jgi:hypothetical protein